MPYSPLQYRNPYCLGHIGHIACYHAGRQRDRRSMSGDSAVLRAIRAVSSANRKKPL